jgi:hypothetical protein
MRGAQAFDSAAQGLVPGAGFLQEGGALFGRGLFQSGKKRSLW